jgi:hypothetical protein
VSSVTDANEFEGELEPPAFELPSPARDAETVYIFRQDPETQLPVIVGKVFIDTRGDAWVKINSTDLAAGIGVTDIDGISLVDRDAFNAQELE